MCGGLGLRLRLAVRDFSFFVFIYRCRLVG